MTKQKRVATKVVVGIFGALLLALPGLVGAQKEGGTLTVGLETDVRGFDGVKGGVLGASGGAVARTIAEPLLAIEPKTGKLLPHLAVSWSSSNDLKTWTFRLRQGVRFHDGTPFTAKDVADNWNRILNPKNRARSRAFLTPIKGAMALDAHTVRFELAHPWMSFPAIFSPRPFSHSSRPTRRSRRAPRTATRSGRGPSGSNPGPGATG